MRARSISTLRPDRAVTNEGCLPLLDLAVAELPLTAVGVFGSARPLEVEVGGGKGRFLLEWASSHPEIGLIVIERARKYCMLAATRAARRGIENVRLLSTTAEDLLFRCLAPASIAALHVYFPDPWPKKKHHKRRFVRLENVARAAAVLVPGGLLRIKTDHADYAEVIASVLAAEPALAETSVELAFNGVPETGFEVKYARENRKVYRFAYRRRA